MVLQINIPRIVGVDIVDICTIVQIQTIETMSLIAIAAITAAISAASAGYGAYKSGQANKKNKALLDQMENENTAEYIKDYYRGALENPGSKAYLKRLDQTMRDNTKAIENTAASTGATHENILAAKESNNRVMSDAVSGLVQNEDQRKESIKNNYLQRKQALLGGQMGMNSQVAQNWATTAGNISSSAGSLASAYMQSNGKLLTPKSKVGNPTITGAPQF